MNLARYAEYWAKMRGDATAAVFKGNRLSWAELDFQANAVAAAMQEMGVKKGDRVGCLLLNSMEWVVTFVAIFKAGAILVPLNPRYGDGELREIEAQVGCRVVVSIAEHIAKIDPEIARKAANASDVFLFPRNGTASPVSFKETIAKRGIPHEVQTEADDIAVITFTSGSTGLPKGAMLRHRAIVANAFSVTSAFRWTSAEQVLLLAPFAFTGGVISVFSPTYIIGACIHIEESFDPERALATIAREGITALTGVPILWERMAASANFDTTDLSSLRAATAGGAPVSQSLLKRYVDRGVCIRQAYGCTEACSFIAFPNEDYAIAKPWSCGWPLPTIELRVIDSHDQPCATGETGEILLRGEQLFSGYWENPTANAEAWSDGWYRTGDLGRLDEMGHLQVTDRKKNMVITGGVNVYPAEVERAMSGLPGVAEVVAFGMPDPIWGERLVAVVHGPNAMDPQALLAQCRAALGSYKTPKELIVSSQPLPRTSSGKVLRGRSNLNQLYAELSQESRATAN